jgi:hypothetical protein
MSTTEKRALDDDHTVIDLFNRGKTIIEKKKE